MGVGWGGDLRGVADKAFGEAVGEGGDLVDDEEGVADDGGLYGGGSAGDDAGAGVVEGLAGVGYEGDAEAGGLLKIGADEVGVEGGGYGKEEFGWSALVWRVVGEEGGGAEHLGEVEGDFFAAGAGEESDPGCYGVEVVLGGVGLAGDGGEGEFGEGVAGEGGVYVAGAVEGDLEGEDDHHAVDALLDPAEAAALPGPELGADEPEDGDAEASAVFGEAEVDVGEVDEDSYGGALGADGVDEAAVLAVDVGGVADDFGDAHVGDVLGADDAGEAGGGHLLAAEAEEGGLGEAVGEFCDDLGAVVVAAGFSGGEEDVGCGGHGWSPPSL